MKNLFFNSSMPRSGSTLLQNILNQNPLIYATPTDGSLELLFGARINFTNGKEFQSQDQEQMLRAWFGFCNGGLQGYATGLTTKPNVCIKSRGIGIHYDWYNNFLQHPLKIICCVRNLKGIFASMEKMFRKNQGSKYQDIQNHSQMKGTTTFKRVMDWVNSAPIGLALERFHQMIHEKTLEKCLVIKAENLTKQPEIELNRIYDYLELPTFQHDFNHVQQVTQEDDTIHGFQGLHQIRPKVEPIVEDWNEILGKEACDWIDNIQWYKQVFGY